ncbi:hypothetical protein S83_059580, partial [Arachis hypogaea]
WVKIDPRHRYGHNLHYYYEEWCKTDSSQPFFYWYLAPSPNILIFSHMLILLYESRARLVHVHGNFLVYIFLILNKYALTMNPLARSLEEFLPHRISSTTWCFMLLRTILVMATHLTGFLIPYY